MCMSGRPPTGRTLIRSAEMSVTLGATMTWTSWSSSSQAIRAELAGRVEGAAGDEDDVGVGHVDGVQQVSGVPITWTPAPVSLTPSQLGTRAPTTS